MPAGNWSLRIALWMSRRNGISLAQRLLAEGKRYPPQQLKKVLREKLEPLAAGMDPQVRERLTMEAMDAAKEWLQKHEA